MASGVFAIANQKASKTTRFLYRIPFEECYEASENGRNLPASPGIYAFKHRNGKILYIGKSINIRNRFKQGHDVFVRLFFAGCSAPDIRIAVVPIIGDYLPLLEIIEAILISTHVPKFNKHIPPITEIARMLAVHSFTLPADVQITDLLPANVVTAIKDYAATNRLTNNQVIELALAQFLDFDAVTLDAYDYQSFAELKNQIAMLKAELECLKQEASNQED